MPTKSAVVFASIYAVCLNGCGQKNCSDDCEIETVGCEVASTAPLTTISSTDWPSGLDSAIEAYSTIPGEWSAQYKCDSAAITVQVKVTLPPQEELDVILGPPDSLDPNLRYRCQSLALTDGTMLLTGTGEPLVDEIPFELDLRLNAPEDGEILIGQGRHTLAQDSDYEFIEVGVVLRKEGLLSGTILFAPHLEDGGTTTRPCVLTDWVSP